MLYNSKDNSACYFPPILGNGEISFAPDCEGTMNYTMSQYVEKGLTAFDGLVVRCGRRCSRTARTGNSFLFSFGRIFFGEGSRLEDWSQELIEEKGCVESNCTYADGVNILSNAFIHPTANIYALNKVFENSADKEYYYDFVLEGFNDAMKEITTLLYTRVVDTQVCIGFKMYGMDVYTGEIRLCMDVPFDMQEIENGVRLTFKAKTGDNATLFYYLEDNLEVQDFAAALDSLNDKINSLGYTGLLAECVTNYGEFFDQGYVKSADERLNAIYKTSLYDLKCYTTKYSVPIGLNNNYWNGRYFAFDEYYSFFGLLTSNRAEIAKRVPDFRLDVCLDKALWLASDCHKNENTEETAKFFWETGEKADVELAPPGTWIDHIFHMPVVGIGAYEYYEFTHDKEFLSRCYRMIRACAKYFTRWMVYRDDKRTYIGKCTDLERLGSAVENPFMTACGAIKLLECCADAAEILGIDEEYRKECRETAAELRKNLPVENGMYVPLLNCEQKSIAVFAGKYPFNVIDDDDENLHKAWQDFEVNGGKYGNMYPQGKNISPWYACWKAEGYARCNMADEAYNALCESYKSAGVFNELFEINEETVRIKPWFTTAGGMFISSVNEMLIQSEGKTVTILPAYPEKAGDVSFKLAVKGGAVANVVVENQKLKHISITKCGQDVTSEYEIFFRKVRM